MKICKDKIDLLLHIISFAQSNKEQFQKHMSLMYGIDYSREDVKEILEGIQKDMYIQKYD